MKSNLLIRMILRILVLVIYCSSTSSLAVSLAKSEGEPNGQDVINSIHKEDRGLFVLFHLSIGLNQQKVQPRIHVKLPRQANIPDDKYEEFQNVETPPEFSKKMLNWSKSELNITDHDVLKLITYSTICIPQKGCFDPNDIGSMCCPF